MWSPKILLGLAATASAIDVRLFTGGGCGGNSVVCSDWNPATCCAGSTLEIFPSIGFYGIPEFWNIAVRGWGGANCARLIESQTANGVNFKCLENGFFSGAGYVFNGRKRADGSDEECNSYQKPDTLLFEDGTHYNIAGLDDAPLTELVCFSKFDPLKTVSSLLTVTLYLTIAANGGNATDVPKKFLEYKIE